MVEGVSADWAKVGRSQTGSPAETLVQASSFSSQALKCWSTWRELLRNIREHREKIPIVGVCNWVMP
jgi:hypothetical protein